MQETHGLTRACLPSRPAALFFLSPRPRPRIAIREGNCAQHGDAYSRVMAQVSAKDDLSSSSSCIQPRSSLCPCITRPRPRIAVRGTAARIAGIHTVTRVEPRKDLCTVLFLRWCRELQFPTASITRSTCFTRQRFMFVRISALRVAVHAH